MTFVNRVPNVLPGFGTPIQNDTLQLSSNVSLSTTSAQTNTLSGITPTFSKGYVRVKIYGGGGTTPALSLLQVVVSDGTTFVGIFYQSPVVATNIVLGTGAAAGSPYTNAGVLGTSVGGYDALIPFEVDINCTQISVITTLSGTTPTAKLDFEVSATS